MSASSFSLTCGGAPFSFPIPTCGSKPVDFVKIFHSSICSTDSYQLIGRLYNSRKHLVTQLLSSSASLSEKLHSIDDYIQYVVPFFNSMKNQGSVRLDVEMMFEWTGAFSSDRRIQKFPDIIFEVAMVLHTKAVLHHCLGRQLLYSDPTNNVAVAGQNFHAASGIMDYLASILLPQWTTTAKRPIETNIMFCRAMREFFTAEAQQMAVVKETQKTGGSLSSLMARLCVAALRATDEGLDHLDKVPKESHIFPTEVAIFNRTFYASLAYYYSGELARIKEEAAGLALGYYRESLGRMNELYTGTKENIDKFNKLTNDSPFMKDGLQYLTSTVKSMQSTVERDNNMIFFQEVPNYRDLPSLPSGVLVMPTKIYIPPINENIIIFTYDEQRKSIALGTEWSSSSFGSIVTGIQSDKLTESMKDNKVSIDADHEFAMALQKKINEGQSI